ncbi:hypothetical protein NITLEN_100060 [Nitrospira lenta]|uniref:Uncharacterized protein n=1 Tax=Nitrospira lenta TaxID=1436998 RepID=A0A330L5F1_9BACT|nr:hypothetical protein NITLEN_100060 [Nitrospira lenta]
MRIGRSVNVSLKYNDHARVFMHDVGSVRQARTGSGQAQDRHAKDHPPEHENTASMTHTFSPRIEIE